MKTVDIEIFKRALERADIDGSKINAIVEDLMASIFEDKEPKERAVKKQFVVCVHDPYDNLSCNELTGWVLQIPENKPVQNVLDYIRTASCDFNLSPKGQRMPFKTFVEAFEYLPSKIAKANDVYIKTKQRVLIVRTPRLLNTEDEKDLFDE